MLDVISAGEPQKTFIELDTSDNLETGVKLSRSPYSPTLKPNTLNASDLFKPVENYDDPKKHFKRKVMPSMFYSSSAVFHLFNSLFTKFLPESIKSKADKAAVNFSKIGHSLIQLDLAKESYANNRSLDFIAKTLEPILMMFVDLQDIPLIKGWSGALNMLDFAQAGRVGNQQNSIKENLQENIREQKRMFHEILNPTESQGVFKTPKDEKGHTMALSAYLMLSGSMLGTCFGLGKRNLANKYGSLLKNIGALVSNYSMWIHPNENLKKAGKIYSLDAVLDTIQRFMQEDKARPLNHLVMAINNIASNFYSLSSRNLNEASTLLYA
jgi:hypothetical protein